MSHAYDSYDYRTYWEGRSYEHNSEVLALKGFLSKIPKTKKIIDIGCGFGRLCPYYKDRAREVVLTDPSKKNLEYAQDFLKDPHLTYIKTTIDNLPNKIRMSNFDLAILVRVMHHLENPEEAILNIKKILNKNGYFILEFANKLHYKAMATNMLKGNFTYPMEIFPIDKRSKANKNKKTLPFLNYHPDYILDVLTRNNFKIIDVKSVSNIRHTFIKKYLPLSVLVAVEKYFQRPFNHLRFGPSMFVLAQKEE